ncbi:MAG: alpha/beta fold hydrolase, partial [Solirubrobacteraceae bacterium]
MTSPPRRSSVELAHGPLAHVEAGDGPNVVLLHQTPRSADEYRDVLPLLAAAGRRAIAVDTPGFGGSAPLRDAPSIEGWATAILAGLDGAAIERCALVGHHTGGVIAVALAALAPARVSALVLSSTPLTDAAYRAQPPDESGVDAAEDADGLRRSRAGFYPPDRPDLLDRYVADALAAGALRLGGHHAVGTYEMDGAIPALRMPTLLIGATADPYAHPQLARMAAALPAAEVVEIDGGMVPLPDGWPDEFAGAIIAFLDRVDPRSD